MSVQGAELSTVIPSDVLRGWVHLTDSTTGQWQIVIEREPVQQFVSDYASQTDVPATNATFAFQNGDDVNVSVVPSAEGRAADIEATANNIMQALQARATGTPSDTAQLALGSVPPQFTTDDADAIASRVTKIGEWTTKYIAGPLNGNGANIEIPTDIINSYVVEPGQLFDFLAVIGPITSPPYTAGGGIVHGHSTDGVLGGGMCSCSTTLFNAAMRAGLDMHARRNHAYYITRYPVGLDATVWIASAKSRQTMSFVNDLQYPVLIKGINRPNEVTFELYGVPDGRTVELSEPVIENAEVAQEYFEYTDELAPGKQSRQEYTIDGFDSTVVRTVYDAAGNVIHRDTFKSNYDTVDGVVLVGRYPGDPAAGNRVLASVWRANHPH
jgi:vancomycin resistance protein YoaR